MSEEIIGATKHGNVTVLTMNYRPYNLMGPTLFDPLIAKMGEAVAQGSRAIVLRSGLRHYCAGADVTQFEALLEQGGKERKAGTAPMWNPVDVLNAFENLPVPIVASVHGACLGGGVELDLFVPGVLIANSSQPKRGSPK